MAVLKIHACRLFSFVVISCLSSFLNAGTPTFSIAFSPTTIAPGATSRLTYTIDNSANTVGITAVSFSNTLPTGMTIKNPSRATTDCLNGSFTATPAANSVSFSNYRIAKGSSCTLSVDVTSSTVGTHSNTTGALSTSEGSAGTANASLTVDATRPGFSAAFSPSSINEGAVSRLTYTVDNSLNGSNANFLAFTETLPAGLVVADEPNVANTCNQSFTTVSAAAGSDSITMQYGIVNAGATCTIEVNVTAAVAGNYSTFSGELSQNGSSPSGSASALLSVSKPFINAQFPNVAAPGQSVSLTYTLKNTDRSNTATDISFTNDLNATLSGLTATALPSSGFCGDSSTISGSSTITVSNASVASGASCTFSLTVLVPANAAAGSYTNNTSTVNLTLGSATTKPAASNTLEVKKSPQLSWSFLQSSVAGGSDVTARFTLSNPDTANALSDIAFKMPIDDVYSGISVKTLPSANSCGSGSTFTQTIVNDAINFTVASASLAAGDSCSFDLVLTMPTVGLAGSFEWTSGFVTGTNSGSTVTGPQASASLTMVTAPVLSLAIEEAVAAPGGTLTANFTLHYSENAAADVTGLGFTVDLDSALSGLSATTLPSGDICGSGSSLTGSSTLTFANGSLSSGESCTFSATLQVPSDASAGSVSVSSSSLSGTSASTSVSAAVSTDTVTVSGLSLSHSFVTNPVLPSGSTVLRYTISNAASSPAATAIQFSHNLSLILSGLQATNLPATPCNGSSAITGTTNLSFSSGELQPNASCSFDVTLAVPSGASAAVYTSVTGSMSATVNSNNTSSPAAYAALTVESLEVRLSSSASNPTMSSPIPVVITFNRSVSNFDVSDLVLSNGSASNFSGSGSQYTVDITPSAAGTVTVDLPANAVDDAEDANHKNPAATQLSMEYETEPSNLVVTVPASALSSSGADYTISGTHSINNSRVYLYADSDNNGVADNSTVIDSAVVDANAWSLDATLALQEANNFVVVWQDRQYGVNRAVDVPTITENTPDYDPVISGSPVTSVDEDSAYSFTPSASDANTNQTISFSIVNQPAWASFNSSTGALTGTPENDDVGTTSSIVITVTDSSNASASLAAFNLTVNNTNDAPVISGTPATSVAEDSAYSFTPTLVDVDSGDNQSFSIVNQPTWASFNSSTGALTGTPANDDVGTTSAIVISVSDNANASDSLAAFNLTVTNSNDAPVISGSPATSVDEDAAYSFTPSTSDVDTGDSLTYSIVNPPSWASFNTSTGALTGTPSNDDVGTTSNIVISVSDVANASDSLAAFNLTVSNTNDAPVISGTPATAVNEDAAYSFTPSVSDVDSDDTQTFSITNKPTWASFDSLTGALTGTPTNDDLGTTSGIVISVADAASASDSLAAFNLTVSNTNDAPVISGTPDTAVNEDAAYSFTPTVVDVDSGDTQSFSIVNKPSWASFDTSTGALSGTPTNDDLGTTSAIVISVSDGANASDSLAAFNLTVSNTNDAPVISGTPATSVNEDAAYSFTPTAADVDSGDTQTFSITNKPSWASFDTATGALTGTPSNDDVGTTSGIVISVADAANASDSLAAFDLTVSNTNDAPVISGTPATSVNEDAAYSFSPIVVDVDSGDTQSFSIVNKPIWASFNSSTGALTGTPTNDDLGTTSAIVISVSDGANASDSLAAFNLTVNNTNDAPVISGTPATSVNEDAAYSFTPTAADVDSGDTQTFSITNKPSWASFNTSTGALTGTPNNDDVGSTSNIVISVSDGANATASLSAFDLQVVNINDAPVISGTPSASVDEDAAYSFTPTVVEVDSGDSLTFSISNPPSWASFDTSSGALTGTPSNDDVGTTTGIVITVTDSANASDSLAAFNLSVSNTNDVPVISGSPNTKVVQNTAYSFTPTVNDVDVGDTLSFSISNQPSWASFDTASGALTGTPSNSDVGVTSNIVISVSDSASGSASLSAFDLTVANTNDAPEISGTPSTSVNQDAAYSFTPTATDIDTGDTVTFSIVNKPSWASFNTSSGELSGTPSNDDVGSTSAIVITVMDNAGADDSLPAFNLSVNNINDAPVISGNPASTVDEDSPYSFTPSASDVDVGDTKSFSIVNQPSWASFDIASGALTGTPSNDDVGTTSGIVITVTDNANASSSLAAFAISVNNTNDAPLISGTPDILVAEDSVYSFTPTASDVDLGDTQSFSIVNQPSWASFDSASGALSGTPTNDDVATTSGIVISVSDRAGASASLAAFNLRVSNTNDAPEISGSPTTSVDQDAVYGFTPRVIDVDQGDTQSFSISNKPLWASFDTSTGALSGTPTNDDIGTTSNIVISVSDSAGASDALAAFSVTVNNLNDQPTDISLSAETVNQSAGLNAVIGTFTTTDVDADSSFTYSLLASDSDNTGISESDNEHFNIQGDQLRVNDPGSLVQGTYRVRVQSSDGAAEFAKTFSISVVDDVIATVSSVTGPSSEVPYKRGSNLDFVVNFTEAVNVDTEGGVPQIALAVGGEARYATYVGGSGSNALLFRYTVLEGDADDDGLDIGNGIELNGGSIKDAVDLVADTALRNVPSLTELRMDGVTPTIAASAGVSSPNKDTSPTVLLQIDQDGTINVGGACGTSSETTVTAGEVSLTLTQADNSSELAEGSYSDCSITITDASGNVSEVLNLAEFVIDISEPLIDANATLSLDEGSDGGIDSSLLSASDSVTTEAINLVYTLNVLPEHGRLLLNDSELSLNGTFSQDDLDNGRLAYRHDGSESRSDRFGFKVQDEAGNGSEEGEGKVFTIDIAAVNDVPLISGGSGGNASNGGDGSNKTIAVNMSEDGAPNAFSLNLNAEDAEGDSLYWTLASPASFGSASIVGEGGAIAIAYTPLANYHGNDSFVVQVSDGNSSDTIQVNVSIAAVNDAPVFSNSPAISVNEDTVYRYLPAVADIEADSLSYSITNKPSWASFDATNGELSGAPGNQDVGSTTGIVIAVSDGQLSTSLPPFELSVLNVNDAPEISGSPASKVDEDSEYRFTPSASDIDVGDTLSYSLSNAPAWLKLDRSSGSLSGIPLNEHVGTAAGIILSVSDGSTSVSLPAFDITVKNTNDAPSISGSPALFSEAGQSYGFAPVATDEDVGDTLSFSVAGLPSWANFDANNGAISGIASEDELGVSNIILTVSDGQLSSELSFNLQVVSAVDSDGDRISDLQEGLDGTDPNDADDYKDDIAPVVIAPQEIIVDASALYTPISLNTLLGLSDELSQEQTIAAQTAMASDNYDGSNCCVAAPDISVNSQVLLPPGRHTLSWQASDRNGNIGSASQIVNVRPLVSLSKDRQSVEGAVVNMRILLNGEAPFYPFSVPYVIDSESTADSDDHNLVNGVVTFEEGEIEALVPISLNQDASSEGLETLVVKLDDSTSDSEDLAQGFDPDNPDIHDINAGAKNRYSLGILEGNLAPHVSLFVEQNGVPTIIVSPDKGAVTVTAVVEDENVADSHSFDWSATENTVVDSDGSLTDMGLIFDPSALNAGSIRIALTVTDSAGASDTVNLYLRIMERLPQLSELQDSDNDGIDDQREGAGDSDDDGIPDYLDNIVAPNVLPEVVDESESFLVECEPGVRCRLGQFALLSQGGGVRLTDEDINEQDNITEDNVFNHVGGIFDFELHELQTVGQSVRIVIPQISAIPQGAVYRKFQEGVWTTFVEDENNSLHSAPGNLGFCPPPGDQAWRAGLNAGDFCVQLSIEDGGPNDADGSLNAAVEDPGAVAVPISEDEPAENEPAEDEPTEDVDLELITVQSTGKGGGGSVSWLILAVLVLMVVCKGVKDAGRTRLSHYLCCFIALLTFTSKVQSAEPFSLPFSLETAQENTHFQFGLFRASSSQSENKFVQALQASSESLVIDRYDVKRTGYRAAFLYDYSEHSALSFGYLSLGDVDVNLRAEISDEVNFARAFADNYPLTGDGYTLSYWYQKQLIEKVQLRGEIGLFFMDGNIDYHEHEINANYQGGTYPLGSTQLLYSITPHISLGANVSLLSIERQSLYLGGLVFEWSLGGK